MPESGPSVIWKGNDKLRHLLVPIETIETHPRNPRRGDLPLLAESLDSFGQTRPIVVQPATGYIVAGNHTYRAAVEVLAWSHIAIIRPELEPDEYEQYLLMDNKASDASEYDEEVLIPILQRLHDTGDFQHTGWDAEQADDFIKSTDHIARTEEQEFQGGYAGEQPGGEKPGRLFERSAKTENQLMLAFNNDDYREIVRSIGTLRREYGTEGIGNTVARALKEQFTRVFEGAS